jgi:hypothetical protein
MPVREVSMRSSIRFLLVLLLLVAAVPGSGAEVSPLPVRGLHVMAPKPAELADCLRFIREALPREGVNLLVVEFNYRYAFSRHPEVVDGDALTAADVKSLAEACRAAGVRLIPQINLIGHQSWAATTFGLLRSHPEFDETPGKYPENKGIYCRSYCPLHPEMHRLLFDLIDELDEACQSDAFHAGMDEIFLLGEDDCPRCRGKNRAELLAGEIRVIRDHLAGTGKTLWIWGDRLLDGDVTGLGKWEAATNATEPAIRLIPKDIVICDWHYEAAPPTALHFAIEGFPVVSSAWRRSTAALGQLELIRHARKSSPPEIGGRTLGVLHTTWTGMGAFVKAYFGDKSANPNTNAIEAALTFKELFREIRAGGGR